MFLDFSEYNHDYNVTNVKNGLVKPTATLNDVSVTSYIISFYFARIDLFIIVVQQARH